MLNTTVVETPLRKGRGPAGKRKSITDRQRPLWMLAPGGVLMTVVIVIPLLLGLYIAVTDLDQYSLRRWLNAPFVGGQNFVEAVVETPLLRSVWISVSFAVLSTIVTVPLGVAAAIVTQNAYKGRALVRAIFLIPYVLPSFVVSTVWRTMLQPDGIVNAQLARIGVDGGLWLSGSQSYWTLILVEIGRRGPSSTCSPCRDCSRLTARSMKPQRSTARRGGTSFAT